VTTCRLLDPDEALRRLETRLGPLHAHLRLGIEREHDAQAFGQGLSFLNLENLPLMQATIEIALRVTGTYWRGRANARKVQVRRNIVRLPNLPGAFDGFTVLHLSDLHADLSGPAMQRAAELAHGLAYDLCVLTGDYRGRTHGDCRPCLEGVARLREALRGDIYAVLGNHDSIAMVPDLEALGIRMLLNECVAIDRGRALIYLAGVDDAHFYRADNIEKAAAEIPQGCVSVLLSHTPEIYPAGRARWFRADVERTYPRRADLFARWYSYPARSRSAPRFRRWRMATCGHGGLYLSGGWVLRRPGSLQQSAGDHAAPVCARHPSVGTIA
jgi:uncharacterized protein